MLEAEYELMLPSPDRNALLVVTAGDRTCALPLHHVTETMRPLPVEPLAGAPSFVCGISVIRGTPTPVVDLLALLDGPNAHAHHGRFVTLRLGDRLVALGVAQVVGVWSLDRDRLSALPPLLREARTDVIAMVGARDAHLLLVLRAARMVPAELWPALSAAGAAP